MTIYVHYQLFEIDMFLLNIMLLVVFSDLCGTGMLEHLCACMHPKSLLSVSSKTYKGLCPTLYDPMGCSPPGSYVCGIV